MSPTLLMPGSSRDKHTHIVGGTGTGKSKFMESLIRQDVLNHRYTGSPIVVLDPHGSLYDNVMDWAARCRLDRPIVPIDLRRDDWVVGYNAIRRRPGSSPSVVVDAFVRTMAHAWGAAGTDQTPLLARWITNLVEVLYEKGLTLPQAIHLLGDNELRLTLTWQLRDQWVQRDWAMAQTLSAKEFEQQVSSTINRLRRFLGAEQLSLMLGQPQLSLDLRQALEEGWIILLALSTERGTVSRQNADLFGSMFLTDLWTAAQERGKRPGLRPCRVYVDEFQCFISPTIAENLDQSRGFGLSWTMAHQFPMQLLDRGEYGRQLFHSVMENASSKIVFRTSAEENLRPLAQWLFTGAMDPEEVKHVLYSTKVMGYAEEMRASITRGTTSTRGGSAGVNEGWTRSTGGGQSAGTSEGEAFYEPDEGSPEPRPYLNRSKSQGTAETFTDASSGGTSETENWSTGDTSSVTEGPVLIPQMGQEVSHVQFRSLEEQQFRSMAALFSQPQQQAVVRLLGMTTPVIIRTETLKNVPMRRDRVDAYADAMCRKWNFCLPRQTAADHITAHGAAFLKESAVDAIAQAEPPATPVKVRRRPA